MYIRMKPVFKELESHFFEREINLLMSKSPKFG